MGLFALVGGHNDIIVGASGNGYQEHIVARQMVDKVYEYLKQLGETVYICTDDVGKTKTQVWSNAVKNCNNAIGSNGRAISIHLNSSANLESTGTEVLTITDHEMAANLSANIANVLGIRDRGVKDGSNIGFINSTQATADLIELCFISNPNDMQQLMSKFDEVAKVIAETLTSKKLIVPVSVASVIGNLEEELNMDLGSMPMIDIVGEKHLDDIAKIYTDLRLEGILTSTDWEVFAQNRSLNLGQYLWLESIINTRRYKKVQEQLLTK